ncbi:MAG: phytanoyl-CoA dioxygenase family protein [Pseudomonadota bacterium]
MIDATTIETFQAEGVVLLRGVFADWVETLRAGITRNMADPSPLERTYEGGDKGAKFFQDYCSWDRIPEYRAFVRSSPMAELAARLMRSQTARIFHEHVLVKEPGSSTATPWHQDQPYYCVDGEQTASFWVALDDVPRERSLEYLAGSHRPRALFRPKRFSGEDLYADDDAPRAPDIEADRAAFDIRGWDVAAGDAIVFNFRVLHAAAANRSPARRRAISFRWVGDDATYAERKGPTSPPFPGLDLVDGAPFDAPQFPVIYSTNG